MIAALRAALVVPVTITGGTWLVEGNVNVDPAADIRIIVTATSAPIADWFLL
jgi:hypothetical protein